MSRSERFAIRFAVFGLAITAVFLAYIWLAGPDSRSETLDWVLSVLCPPSVLTLVFLDLFLDKTATAFVGWLIIGLFNSGIYALVGMVVSKYFWKSGQPMTSTGPPR